MRQFYYTMLMGLALVATSCGNRAKKEFDKTLIELAGTDQEIDAGEWEQIVDYLDRNKSHFKDLVRGGKVDESAVREYISDFFENRRPPKEIKFACARDKQLSFKIYVEQSESMRPYDSPDGDGSFRSAIMALQNSLPGDVRVEKIGEKGYTDFRQIFDNILNKTVDERISILVTDMIYSARDMKGVNPQKVFNEVREMIGSVFKDEVKKKSMLVVRMMGSYNGLYYSYDNSKHNFSGRRPYYIIIVGSNDNIVRLTNDNTLRSFARMQELSGYDNMCLFTTDDIYEPYCSFVTANKDIRGRFRPEPGQGYEIRSLENIEPDSNSGDIQLVLAVDLGHIFADQSYLTDKGNYMIESEDDIKIKEIRKVEKGDLTPSQKKYLASATHLFILSAPEITHGQDVNLKLINHLPAWVERGSTDSDLQPDSHSTFALRHLLGGIYDSYKRNAEGMPTYFELELKLSK